MCVSFVEDLIRSSRLKITKIFICLMLALCSWYANNAIKPSKYLLILRIKQESVTKVNFIKNVQGASRQCIRVFSRRMLKKNSVFLLSRLPQLTGVLCAIWTLTQENKVGEHIWLRKGAKITPESDHHIFIFIHFAHLNIDFCQFS